MYRLGHSAAVAADRRDPIPAAPAPAEGAAVASVAISSSSAALSPAGIGPAGWIDPSGTAGTAGAAGAAAASSSPSSSSGDDVDTTTTIPPAAAFAAAVSSSSSSSSSSSHRRSHPDASVVRCVPLPPPSSPPLTGYGHRPYQIVRIGLLRARQDWRYAVTTIAALAVTALTVRFRGDDDGYGYGHGYGYGGYYPTHSVGAVDVRDGGPYSAPKLALPVARARSGPGEEEERAVRLSDSLRYLSDVNEPMREGDVPLFFHVPRSGGSTVKDIMGMCLGMTEASDVGARGGHKYDKTLEVLSLDDGSRYVNVDTTTAEGIHRAKRLGLVESRTADVVVTQLLHPAATMFNEDQRGRMFTLIRHPIERAVSLFHYLGVADWEPTYDPDLSYISVEMYARSERVEHNWLVRFLSNELEGDLTTAHLEVAMEVLRRKCLVGLLAEKGETFARLERYFGWTYPPGGGDDGGGDDDGRACQERLLHWGWSNKHSHPTVEEGSPAWHLLLRKNDLDMRLYEYAGRLFEEQGAMFVAGGTFGPPAEREAGGPTTGTAEAGVSTPPRREGGGGDATVHRPSGGGGEAAP